MELQGWLVLKGNAPHWMAVLETSADSYQLQGLSATQIQELQRRQVRVQGMLVRKALPPLPALLEVSRIEALE